MNKDYDDTRRFETHAEWCAYLSRLGILQSGYPRVPGVDYEKEKKS
jgi:hypothetical protein